MGEQTGSIYYSVEIETAKTLAAQKKLDAGFDQMQGSMDKTDKAASQLGGGLTRLAQSFAALASAAAVASELKKAIAVTAEFNATISNLSALTGAVGKDLAVFRQAAIDIGGSTSLSASQAAEAMKLIGSASPDLLKSADALKAVTNEAVVLAEAAGVDLPTAATALTATLNQFQLGADQASRVINVLAAGAKEGSSEIEDTVLVLKNAGVVAAQAGLSFEEFNGATQALAAGQIKGAEAGTALRNVLTILNTQGIEKLRPSVVGLSSALENLEKSGMDDVEMVKLFGRENLTAAKVLLQFRDTADQVTEAVTGTSEAYRQAKVNQDNLKGDVAQLNSAYETLQITIGSLSDGALRDLTQTITGLITSVGKNEDVMVRFFETAGAAAEAFSVVILARVVSALAAKSASLYESTIAAGRLAAANVALAESEAVAAASALMQAKASEQAAVGLSTHAAAANALTLAEGRATAATTALSAAQTAVARTASVATFAARGLGAAMGLLGGPVGIALIAAYGIYQLATRVSEYVSTGGRGVTTTENLTNALGIMSTAAERAASRYARLTQGIEKLNKVELSVRTDEVQAALARAESDLKRYSRLFEKGNNTISIGLIDQTKANITLLKSELDALAKKTGGASTVDSSSTSEEGQSGLARMREQLELSKLQGEARARLAAIQRLGAKATEEEKIEAANLAAEIYRLDEAQKKTKTSRTGLTEAQKEAKKAAEDLASAQEQDVKVITDMAEALYQASLNASDLAQRQAELMLSEYATPEQIASVRQLATELQRVDDLENRKKKFGDTPGDVKENIEGDMPPLSGGLFDDQAARYEAEAQAEKKRYAEQLERAAEAQRLGLEVKGGYQAQELQMAQDHAARMDQIESAKNQMMLQSGEQIFGSLASAAEAFAGKQSTLYKTMFAASKAFAIAQAAVSIGQGIAMAAANPWPLNLAAIATVAASTASLVGNIASVTMGSGKALGGPVQASQMYRVNETGAPEIFNAANGRQYMMPNQRGEVVSNRDATSQAGASGQPSQPVIVNQNISVQGRMDNYTASQLASQAAQKQRTSQARFGK